MSTLQILVVALLSTVLCSCQAIKDDPIVGDHPWKPGSFPAPNRN